MDNNEVDYFGNVYNHGQTVEIEGNAILMIAQFLTEVVQKETNFFAPFDYVSKSHEIKDEAGNLIKVASEYKEHTKDSFMMTAADENGAKLGLTSTGVKASQVLSALLAKHKMNMDAGLTIKPQDRNAKDAFN